MVKEQWVIWGYSKHIVKLPTFPGRSALPRHNPKSVHIHFTLKTTLFHGGVPSVETEGREVQSLAHGGSEGQRLCSASQGPGLRGPGLSGGHPAQGLQPRRSPRGRHRDLMAFHFHIRSRRPARRHQEGGFRVTAAARDSPEPEPAAANTYLTASPPLPRPRPAARLRMCTAQTRRRRSLARSSSSGSPRWVLKTASFCLRITGLCKKTETESCG